MEGGGGGVAVGEGTSVVAEAVVPGAAVDAGTSVVLSALKSEESKRRVALRAEGGDDDVDGDDARRTHAAPTMQTWKSRVTSAQHVPQDEETTTHGKVRTHHGECHGKRRSNTFASDAADSTG